MCAPVARGPPPGPPPPPPPPPSTPTRSASAEPKRGHGSPSRHPVTITAQYVTRRRTVSENETPHSGSRWEPGATPEPTAAQPIPAQAWPPPQPVYAEAASAAPARPGRGRLALAAAAVGLVAAGGVG